MAAGSIFRLDEVLAAVDRDGDPGQEPIGQHRQSRARDVLGGADASGGVGLGLGLEQRRLALVAQSVVRAGVDGAGGEGIDPDRGELDSQAGGDGVDGGVGGGDARACQGPASVRSAPDMHRKEPSGARFPGEVLGQQQGSGHLRAERAIPLRSRSGLGNHRGRGRKRWIPRGRQSRSGLLARRSRTICDVDPLSADIRAAIRADQIVGLPPGDDDPASVLCRRPGRWRGRFRCRGR